MPLVETALASQARFGAQSTDQGRKRRLKDRDAESHQQGRGIERPDIERHAPLAAPSEATIASPNVTSPDTPKRAINSAPGVAARANMLKRQPIKRAHLRLGHMQVVVNERDDRRHGEQRNPYRRAGEP